MIEAYILISLGVVGAIFGSFAAATVWRLRARQLVYDHAHGEKVNAKELARLKKLTNKSVFQDHSQCLHCGYELRWFDMIPVLSWLVLRGRCRACHRRIGRFELVSELATGAFFVLSYALWPLALNTPLEITYFVLWLVSGVVLAILFAYDAKWFLLPDSASLALAVLGGAMVIVTAIASPDPLGTVLSAGSAVLVLAGLYLVLYVVSRGLWVGFGDVKLGVGLGLLLGDWQLALLALFLANAVGLLFVAPLMMAKKLTRKSHVPFGPMLIVGALLAWFFGHAIIDWYVGLLVL